MRDLFLNDPPKRQRMISAIHETAYDLIGCPDKREEFLRRIDFPFDEHNTPVAERVDAANLKSAS